MMLQAIGFDADDTLWHNEGLFAATQAEFRQLLANYHSTEWIDQRLLATETQNIAIYGYGVKGFTLSMIETAIELTEGRISGREIQQIIQLAREMLQAPVTLLDGVAEVLNEIAPQHKLILITKGDLLDQELKIARSTIGALFSAVEIVSQKTDQTYRTILERHQIRPEHFLMVGNSLRSDILPAVEVGAHAAYIPYHLTWEHEAVQLPADVDHGFVELSDIRMLPELIARLV